MAGKKVGGCDLDKRLNSAVVISACSNQTGATLYFRNDTYPAANVTFSTEIDCHIQGELQTNYIRKYFVFITGF